VKSHELFTAVDPSIVTQMLDWFRSNDRNVYRSAVATLAQNRKLRPVFVEKKSMPDQYAWITKTLQLKACDNVGEHLLQAWLMSGHQAMLAAFCDGLGIPHDGKGSVVGDLPQQMDPERLKTAVDQLFSAGFEPKVIAVYLHCFNMQNPGGWPELTALLQEDSRLALA
jgi:hypothetical protein